MESMNERNSKIVELPKNNFSWGNQCWFYSIFFPKFFFFRKGHFHGKFLLKLVFITGFLHSFLDILTSLKMDLGWNSLVKFYWSSKSTSFLSRFQNLPICDSKIRTDPPINFFQNLKNKDVFLEVLWFIII